MKIDMANFAVRSIRPHLLQHSVEYERQKFKEFLEKQPSKQLYIYVAGSLCPAIAELNG